MRRLIRYFEKHGDTLVGELLLPDYVTIEKLRGLITADPDDPMMVACYRISHGDLGFFKPLVDHEFQLEEYEYFLEVDR